MSLTLRRTELTNLLRLHLALALRHNSIKNSRFRKSRSRLYHTHFPILDNVVHYEFHILDMLSFDTEHGIKPALHD